MGRYNVKELAKYLKRAKDEDNPFVLFTGAGCSKSAGIPLASELVNEINKKYSLELKELSEADRSNYGKCMEALTKEQRRKLLQVYIQNAKINWAHIGQAQLLKEGYFQRVLTFNFDNILSRSCGLLGLYPSIYDFTSANFDLLDLIVDPSIVHLHGQSHGFIQLNTQEETEHHADQLSQFVASTLSRSSSIFIGYSGQADAFFPVLTEKFDGQHKLFWVGREETIPSHLESLVSTNHAHYLNSEDADRFFIELAQELKCFPPKTFGNPFEHLLDELELVLDFPIQNGADINVLATTRSILKKAKQEKEASTKIDFEYLFMEGEYQKIVEQSKGINLSESDKEYVAGAEIMLGNALYDLAQIEKSPETFKASFEKYEAALAIKSDDHNALNNWGNALSDLAKLEQSPEGFQESFEKYEAALAIKPDKHEALYNWGNALLDLARFEQSPERYQASIEKYKAALAIKRDYHEALNNWGLALSDLARFEQSPEIYQASIEKYKSALEIKPDDHEALNNWGSTLSDLARLEQSPEGFKASFEKYDAALAIKPDYHEALFNWGNALSHLARLEQNPERFKDSFEKYEAALAIKPDFHEALFNWGNALSDLARLEHSPELFKASFEKYEAALAIKRDYYQALNNFGLALSNLARLEQSTERLEEAKEKLLKIQSMTDKPEYNLACIYALNKNEVECKKQLFDCKAAGTLPDKEHLMTDTDLDNVRDCEWFKELLV